MTRTENRRPRLAARSLHRHLSIALVAGALLVPTASAHADCVPVGKCLVGKLKTVSASLMARTTCFSKEASTGVPNPSCHQKASDKLASVFPKLETKYNISSVTPCFTFGDLGAIETALATYAASVPLATGSAIGRCDNLKIKCVGKYVGAIFKCASKAAAELGNINVACSGRAAEKLANGANGCLDKAAQSSGCTNGGNQAVALQGAADEFIEDTLDALSNYVPDPRYVDNGDGTVTDTQTGLMWEQKTTAVGSGQNYADPHDVDNHYIWSTGGPPWNPDGPAFTDFLVKLNTPPCFAGHCDWRLPSEEGRNSPFTGPRELESILAPPNNRCRTIDSIFEPVAHAYWSATTAGPFPDSAWYVFFDSASVYYFGNKGGPLYVRAVRTGP